MVYKKKKSKFMQVLKFKISNAMSMFLLFIAFISFLIIGFNQKSYAIPDVQSPLDDSFQFGSLGYDLFSNPVSYNGANIAGVTVTKYFTSLGDPIFCLEHNAKVETGITYNKGELINDYGLLYIMANSYPNKILKDSNGQQLDSNFQTWITQVSIWLYLYYAEAADNGSVSVDSVNYLTDEQLYSMMYGREVTIRSNDTNNGKVFTTLGDDTIYDTYIKDLVDNALKVRTNPNKNLEINMENKNISITNDEKYYQTSLITVTGSPSDNFNGYEIKLKNVPDGTIVVDEDGNEIKDFTNLSVTNKFYLRVPVESVNEQNKKMTVTAIGSFKTYEGNYYRASGYQTVTSVKTVNNNLEKDLNIDLDYTVLVSDTDFSISWIVYFVGILLLLCGIAILCIKYKSKSKSNS